MDKGGGDVWGTVNGHKVISDHVEHRQSLMFSALIMARYMMVSSAKSLTFDVILSGISLI